MSKSQTPYDGFHSEVFKSYGTNFGPGALRDIDTRVYNYEAKQESKIADLDKHNSELLRELQATKETLKRLQESRFKSRERELAVGDSTLGEMYDSLVGDIKAIVLRLTRSADTNVNNLIKLMSQSTQYQEGLKKVLEPNFSPQQFVEIMGQSKGPNSLLGWVLRAIIHHQLRRRLFNHNVFLCTAGENWKSLRHLYTALLVNPEHNDPEGAETSTPLRYDKASKDASIWRHHTLTTLDRNIDRLQLKEGRAAVLHTVMSNIEGLLLPLVGSDSEARKSLNSELSSLVEFAADLAIKLGKSRAMFELKSKNFVGSSFRKSLMDPVGPWSHDIDGDDDEQPGPKKSHEALFVVVPALMKFGNDDGEEFDNCRILKKAQVFVVPVKEVQNPTQAPVASTDKGESSSSNPVKDSSNHSSDEKAPKGVNADAPSSATDEQTTTPLPPKSKEKEGEPEEAVPEVAPQDTPNQVENPAEEGASTKDEQKVLSSEISILESQKAIVKNQKTDDAASPKPSGSSKKRSKK